uniref:SDR family oxidoreductase n=1 Tax=Streptomyces sp. NBC_00093 TaxID=2975649 RepID=A0AAU2AFC8_9ACTN
MTGRICVVTGAGRGIGRAAALRLSAEGHRVALVSRTEHELLRTAASCPGETLVLPTDVTGADSAGEVLDAVAETWGPAQILVVAAGRNRSAPLERTSDAHWQEMLALNLTSVFQWLRAALPPMASAGWGRAVVVSSIAGKRGFRHLGAYSAAKHGVIGLVRSAALELARTGVTVNAVCPAYVDTDLTARTVDTIVTQAGWTRDEALRHVNDLQPIGRMVTPEEVVAVIGALIENAALTGQSVHVDGGLVQ